jgi:hypothetical protein
MTPAEEQAFITLWNQGASYRELAAARRCPLGTVASRSAALVAQGKIQPRPWGGAYPSRRAKARPDASPPPVQRPVQPLDTGAVYGLDTGAMQRLDRLEGEVQDLCLLVQVLVDRLDGMISNDKCCCTRWGGLQLSWWRRPHRLRR